MKLIAYLGQSNGSGSGEGPPPMYPHAARIKTLPQPLYTGWGVPYLTPPPDPANPQRPLYPLGSGTFVPAVEPLCPYPGSGNGAAMACANRLVEALDEDIGIVICAWPGSEINNLWRSEFCWWTAMSMAIARIEWAKNFGEFIGIDWHHGESASLGAPPTYYQTSVMRVIRDVKMLGGVPDVPWTITKLHQQPPGYPSWNVVQAYQDQMSGILRRVSVVDASDLPGQPRYPVHITTAGLQVLGVRQANALLSMM